MRARALVALTIVWAIAAAAPAAAQEGKKVLRLGQAQEPQTLSPFIDQDEEDFRIWSISYDLLVNFSPKDLGPIPGSPRSGHLAGQEDRHLQLVQGPQVVRRPADHLQGRQVQPRDVRAEQPAVPSYVENITAVETPDRRR